MRETVKMLCQGTYGMRTDGGAWHLCGPLGALRLVPVKMQANQVGVDLRGYTGLNAICSWSGGWDHVSVSRSDRVPNWGEMEAVKHAFFRDDETAMQLHVPAKDHVNNHEYCLHLWRPNDGREIPRPPKDYV